ncbi:MAG: hypothetical protein H6R14_1843 [Proteobacteria bacterium]|nr:hypothetical protein [Pseudomonadota bacterium]
MKTPQHATPFALKRLFAATLAALGMAAATPLLAAPADAQIEMKVLVLTAQDDNPAAIGDAPQLEATKAMLDRIGTPYEIYRYDSAAPSLPALEDGNNAHYQAILLPISDARLLNPLPSNPLAQTLSRYQFKYGVRMAALYAWPDDTGCLQAVGQRDTNTSALDATLTAAGKTAFPYLKAGTSATLPLQVKNAWTYFADPATALPAGATVTPLLQGKASDGSTHTVMASCSFPNTAPETGDASSREVLAATFDNNQYLIHSSLLSYGLLNWLTKGVMLGERRVYLDPQIDDIGLPNDSFPYAWEADGYYDARTTPWTFLGATCPLGGENAKTGTNPCEYRITGKDIDKLVAWQKNVRSRTANAADFRLTMPYNGAGFWVSYGGQGAYPPNKPATFFFDLINENVLYDTLTPRLVANKAQFKWVTHTYDHEFMDDMSYDHALNNEMIPNDKVAQKMGLPNYDKSTMVTPNISGLYNADVLSALQTFGITYLVSDTSVPTPPVGATCEKGPWPLPRFNSGKPNCVNPSIYEVPRYPTALYYNVSTPAEWTAEYNHFYGANGIAPYPWGYDLSYGEVLDKTSEVLVSYLLNYDARPLMFHASNLRAYDGTHSLLGDLMDATLAKYNRYYQNLPIRSPSLKQTGELMKRRQVYNESGVRAVLKPGKGIVLTAANPEAQPVVVPLTGVTYGTTTETYGGQVTSFVTLNPANNYSVNIAKSIAW